MTCTYPLSRILELSKQADEDTRHKELLDCIHVPKELIAELQATSDLEVNSDITAEAASLNAFHLTKLILLIANEAFEKFGISAFCAGGFAEHVLSRFVQPYGDIDIFLTLKYIEGDIWLDMVRLMSEILPLIFERQVDTWTKMERQDDILRRYGKTSFQCIGSVLISGIKIQFLATQAPLCKTEGYTISKDLMPTRAIASNMIRDVFETIERFDLVNCCGSAFWLNESGSCDALAVKTENQNIIRGPHRSLSRRQKYCKKLGCGLSALNHNSIVVGECINTGEKYQFTSADAMLFHRNGVCKIFETRDIEVEHPVSIDGKGIKKFGLAAKHSLFEELWVLEFEFMDSFNTHNMKLYGPLHSIFDSDVTLGLKNIIEQIATAGHDCSSTAGRYKVLRECVEWYLG